MVNDQLIEQAIHLTRDGGPANLHRVCSYLQSYLARMWEREDFTSVQEYFAQHNICARTLPDEAMSNGSREDLRRRDSENFQLGERERQRRIRAAALTASQANRRNARSVEFNEEEKTALEDFRDASGWHYMSSEKG